nr:glycerophosphodiester phosphodiesterase [Paenibacillus turpanensis]
MIYAHRGASGDAPENTMAAFRLALEQGAEGIELDIHQTKDGQLVVIHDETLERTTNGSGLITSLTYDEIRSVDASFHFESYRGEHVPLLSEVLDLLSNTQIELNIELKNGIIRYEGMEERVIRLVREYGMENRVVFSSFNHYSVVDLIQAVPDMDCALLYTAGLYHPWKYANSLGARSLHPLFYSVDPEMVQGAHDAGLKVRPYTVNEEKDIRAMIANGVDAVITNYPSLMKQILTEQSS